jgi:3-deoxy-D-manno-octulosonic-acid transferase
MSLAPTKIEEATRPAAAPRVHASAPALRAYRTLTWLARPMAGMLLRHRERRGKEEAARLGERLGEATLPRPPGPLVWCHAASVGEASSVLPLLTRLSAERPDVTLLLTTGTVTSARMLATRLPPRTLHQYVPLDAPQLVARFLDHWRPALAIFTEQEIWPNLVVGTSARGIPLAIVNARMSAGSHARWSRRQSLAAALFTRFDVVLAQTEEIAARFRSLGAGSAHHAGNMKIDAPAPPADAAALAHLEASLHDRPCILAASTHPGEEAIVADAHARLATRFPGLLTIIAPRHPERGGELAQMLSQRGFKVARRAEGASIDPSVEIYIADTIGELGTFYRLAPLAFIGGSFIPHGGQNPIEAVRCGAVVLTGPSRENFVDVYDALIASGGALPVQDADALTDAISTLLEDPAHCEACRLRATAAVDRLSGALERTLAALRPLLPPEEAARAP